jgi:lysophospholipid acyltransferase (LPLAT)-like uncharacterized protein
VFVSSVAGASGLGSRALFEYLALVRRTSRFELCSVRAWLDRQAGGMSGIVAIWHEELLLHVLFPQAPRTAVLVTADPAAETYAATLTRMGFIALRGGTRGVLRAAQDILSQSGGVVAIAVDGPWGPARVAKPGIALLARLSGSPIIPLHCVVGHAVRARSWDATLWPRPFNEFDFRAGEPIRVGPHDRIDATTALLQSRLDLFTQHAENAGLPS